MADKRMFSKSLIERDCFTELPLSAQALYFHLGLHMDDDGFCDRLKNTLRMIGASEDDVTCLIEAGFLYRFESGVVVDLYWPSNNLIRKDRYKPTIHKEEMNQLEVTPEGNYKIKDVLPNDNQMTTNGVPNDNQRCTNGTHRLGKVSIGYREIDARAREEDVFPVDNVDNSCKTVDNSKPDAEQELCDEAVTYYQNRIRPLKNIDERDLIYDLVSQYGLQRFKDSVDKAKRNGGRSLNYVDAVCRNNKGHPAHNDPVAGAAAAEKILETGEIIDFNST